MKVSETPKVKKLAKNKRLKVLELFAGSRSIGKVAEALGHEVFSVDHVDFENMDLVKDIEFLTVEDIPFKPDIIWSSPPCTSYSIAGGSYHRTDGKNGPLYGAKTEFAKKSDRMIKNVLSIIEHFDCVFYLENPVGMLRKMDFMKPLERSTVTYCQYSNDERMKPTDIFTNNAFSLHHQSGWRPKPKCFNGNRKCHHEPAPRGSKTGTQGRKGNYERSIIPFELCLDIMKAPID